MLGIKESCEANGLSYTGGNIREADKLSAVGVALGFSHKNPLTRSGAKAGHKLYVFGKSGRFWSDVLEFRAGRAVDRGRSPLFCPVSQAKNMYLLHERDLVVCAMDTSDGLAPTLEELAKKNNLGILIQTKQIRRQSNDLTALERPERLWMGWGDWTVVAAIKPECIIELHEMMNAEGIIGCEIGEFVDTAQGVQLRDAGSSVVLGRLESERFAPDSWFHLGVEAYEEMLRNTALPTAE